MRLPNIHLHPIASFFKLFLEKSEFVLFCYFDCHVPMANKLPEAWFQIHWQQESSHYRSASFWKDEWMDEYLDGWTDGKPPFLTQGPPIQGLR